MLVLKGAYGRVYHTAAQAMQDWNEGKDFMNIFTLSYLSIRDTGYLYSVCNHRQVSIKLSTDGLYHVFSLKE